jgi:hypothetical protein
MTAEAKSHSSEKERLRVIMGDSEFGPEEVGENSIPITSRMGPLMLSGV